VARLWDLMSKDDLARYAHVPVECRAAVAVGEAKAMLASYAQQVSHQGITRHTPLLLEHHPMLDQTVIYHACCSGLHDERNLVA
jgi:hypothetical protein